MQYAFFVNMKLHHCLWEINFIELLSILGCMKSSVLDLISKLQDNPFYRCYLALSMLVATFDIISEC